jgi:hypothetical protein
LFMWSVMKWHHPTGEGRFFNCRVRSRHIVCVAGSRTGRCPPPRKH